VISISTPEVAPVVTPEVGRMLSVLKKEMSRKEIQHKLGLKDEKHFREAYIRQAIDAGLIEMTIPDKPNSRLQKYRITPKGVSLIQHKNR
jgi:predicted transcriptional regulator